MAHVYQQVPKNIREKWHRDYKEEQRIQAKGKTNEYTSFWNQADYFTANWWQDEDKLKQAEQALRTEISIHGKLSLYDIKDPNKMAALQRIVNVKRTQVWDEKTLNAIEDGLVAMGVDSSNTIELDKEKLDALISRYNRGVIGQKSGDYMERTGLGDLIEETIYGIVGFRVGMKSVGEPSVKPKQPPISEKPPVKSSDKGGSGVNEANSSRSKEPPKSTNSSKSPEGTGKASESYLTPEMEQKILGGERIPGKNGLRGGHSPNVVNDANPNYAVEVLRENPDGTKFVQFYHQFPDGTLAKLKKSTVFPDSWSDEKIISSIKKISDTPAVGSRTSDGGTTTLHSGTVDGVEIDVIKEGNNITAGYPVGGKPTPGFEPIN
ncbi:EndoU domain-containing protein [Paenibacillus azoreducens]